MEKPTKALVPEKLWCIVSIRQLQVAEPSMVSRQLVEQDSQHLAPTDLDDSLNSNRKCQNLSESAIRATEVVHRVHL